MSAAHNKLAHAFVQTVIREIIESGGNANSVMVVLESVVLGGLLANERVFGASRRVSAEMLDALALAVAERLAEAKP